jgi:hypothetical protein
MSPRAFVVSAGVALLLLGLALLVLPVSVTVAGATGPCGATSETTNPPSSIMFNNQAYLAFQDECADATGTREAWSWGLMGIGLLTVIGGALVQPRSATAPRQSVGTDDS